MRGRKYTVPWHLFWVAFFGLIRSSWSTSFYNVTIHSSPPPAKREPFFTAELFQKVLDLLDLGRLGKVKLLLDKPSPYIIVSFNSTSLNPALNPPGVEVLFADTCFTVEKAFVIKRTKLTSGQREALEGRIVRKDLPSFSGERTAIHEPTGFEFDFKSTVEGRMTVAVKKIKCDNSLQPKCKLDVEVAIELCLKGEIRVTWTRKYKSGEVLAWPDVWYVYIQVDWGNVVLTDHILHEKQAAVIMQDSVDIMPLRPI